MLEPNGGNLYRPHTLQVHSGLLWRCAHDTTGFGKDMDWIGCEACAKSDPAAYAAWHRGEPPNEPWANAGNASSVTTPGDVSGEEAGNGARASGDVGVKRG